MDAWVSKLNSDEAYLATLNEIYDLISKGNSAA